MHNGGIGEFGKVKRKLSHMLSDSSYDWIQGTTDSEHIFGLFADELSALKNENSVEAFANALMATIGKIEWLRRSTGHDAPCDLNLVVTDGRSAVVSRYSSEGTMPNSLHIHTGHRYTCESGDATLTPCDTPTVLVASEALTSDASWRSVDPNHLILIDESLEVDIRPIIVS